MIFRRLAELERLKERLDEMRRASLAGRTQERDDRHGAVGTGTGLESLDSHSRRSSRKDMTI